MQYFVYIHICKIIYLHICNFVYIHAYAILCMYTHMQYFIYIHICNIVYIYTFAILYIYTLYTSARMLAKSCKEQVSAYAILCVYIRICNIVCIYTHMHLYTCKEYLYTRIFNIVYAILCMYTLTYAPCVCIHLRMLLVYVYH